MEVNRKYLFYVELALLNEILSSAGCLMDIKYFSPKRTRLQIFVYKLDTKLEIIIFKEGKICETGKQA